MWAQVANRDLSPNSKKLEIILAGFVLLQVHHILEKDFYTFSIIEAIRSAKHMPILQLLILSQTRDLLEF